MQWKLKDKKAWLRDRRVECRISVIYCARSQYNGSAHTQEILRSRESGKFSGAHCMEQIEEKEGKV